MTQCTINKLIWLGIFAALTIIGATAVNLARRPSLIPSPPPINHCSGSDAANRWCIR